MRKNQLLLVALAALMACPAIVRAQSLADIARAEEARRKTVKVHGKVYTNDDLRGDGTSAPAPATPSTTTGAATDTKTDTAKPPAPTHPAAAPADDGVKKDEKYWRDRITSVQQGLARNKVLLDALQSRVNGLNTEFTNMDDPSQRGVIEENRKTALTEMERVKKDIENQSKEIVTIQEDARRASVPPGWLR